MTHTEVRYEALGDSLLQYAHEATEQVVLAAPFIKHGTLEQLLDAIPVSASLYCITRWRPDEIVHGASDLEVWPLVKERADSSLLLYNDLHAKYYRFDNCCFIGSANLTDSALGWRARPNLELLLRLPVSSSLRRFEEMLLARSLEVTDDLHEHLKLIVAKLGEMQPASIQVHYDVDDASLSVGEPGTLASIPNDAEAWIPSLRHPEQLFEAYAGRTKNLTSVAREDAARDLALFDLPSGLDREAFRLHVGWQLLQMPIIQHVDAFVATPQRFGAVRDYLKTLPCASHAHFDASEGWQVIMRWLLHFLKERYYMRVANYSEIFGRQSGVKKDM